MESYRYYGKDWEEVYSEEEFYFAMIDKLDSVLREETIDDYINIGYIINDEDKQYDEKVKELTDLADYMIYNDKYFKFN